MLMMDKNAFKVISTKDKLYLTSNMVIIVYEILTTAYMAETTETTEEGRELRALSYRRRRHILRLLRLPSAWWRLLASLRRDRDRTSLVVDHASGVMDEWISYCKYIRSFLRLLRLPGPRRIITPTPLVGLRSRHDLRCAARCRRCRLRGRRY